jgi:hypothetical protein
MQALAARSCVRGLEIRLKELVYKHENSFPEFLSGSIEVLFFKVFK